jgi:hypothetical protein
MHARLFSTCTHAYACACFMCMMIRHVYVFMCVCIYVCICYTCIYVFLCLCERAPVRVWICMCAHMYLIPTYSKYLEDEHTHTHTHIRIHIHPCVYVCLYVCVWLWTCVYYVNIHVWFCIHFHYHNQSLQMKDKKIRKRIRFCEICVGVYMTCMYVCGCIHDMYVCVSVSLCVYVCIHPRASSRNTCKSILYGRLTMKLSMHVVCVCACVCVCVHVSMKVLKSTFWDVAQASMEKKMQTQTPDARMKW